MEERQHDASHQGEAQDDRNRRLGRLWSQIRASQKHFRSLGVNLDPGHFGAGHRRRRKVVVRKANRREPDENDLVLHLVTVKGALHNVRKRYGRYRAGADLFCQMGGLAEEIDNRKAVVVDGHRTTGEVEVARPALVDSLWAPEVRRRCLQRQPIYVNTLHGCHQRHASHRTIRIDVWMHMAQR